MNKKANAGNDQHHYGGQTVQIKGKARAEVPHRHPGPGFIDEVVLAGADEFHCN